MVREVFISSTEDLKDYREKTKEAILRSDLHPVMMEYFASSGAAIPLDQCLAKVKASDVLVVLVAHRYGWVPPDQVGDEHKSITWLECQQAVDCHKEVLAFLIDDSFSWPENLKEEYNLVAALRDKSLTQEVVENVQRNREWLGRFKEWLNARGIRASFTTPEDLEIKVLHALADWRWRIDRKGKRVGAKYRGDDSEALEFRGAYRSRLTELMCLYYRHAIHSEDLLVAPDRMPVLSQPHLIPEEPCRLDEIDHQLILSRENPRVQTEDTMSSLLQKRTSGPGLFNGLLFRFLGFDVERRFKFCLGSYFDFLNTCEFLGHELAKVVAGNSRLRDLVVKGKALEDPAILRLLNGERSLPTRSRSKVLDFASRCTAFGSCALVVLKRSNQSPQIILNARSSELAETAGLLHVIPAGTFQPTMQDGRFLPSEFSLTENLVREFAEELFDDAGISGREARKVVFGTLDDMYGPRGKDFRARVTHQRKYKLIYLGTVIDPVNLKPEILTVFMLHEGYLQAVSGQELTPSWETDAGEIRIVEFSEDRLDSVINDEKLVPTGKAHLMLVRKHFRRLSSELESI